MTEVLSIIAKIYKIIFWIENDSPAPSELFRKFIRFGVARLPLVQIQFKYKQKHKYKCAQKYFHHFHHVHFIFND